jgi:hypothetical protein
MIKRSLSSLLTRVLEIYIAERVTDPAPIFGFGFTMNGIIDVGISQKITVSRRREVGVLDLCNRAPE